MSLPATPAEITVEWLNDVLPAHARGDSAITSISLDDIGEGTGIFGEIARLDLSLATGETTSVIAKMQCSEPANLEIALMLGIYEREIQMFANIIPRSSLTAPECYLAERGEDGKFMLLLEDMGVSWDVGDQVVGATIKQAEAIVDELIAFHVEWWEHPELATFDWLPTPDAPQYMAAVPGIYRAGLPVLQAEWTDRVSAEAIGLAGRVEPIFEELLTRTSQGPETLIHTDTRLDNIFFAKDGSGKVAFIDFQLALRGRAVADIAYLTGTSVPHELAREHWEDLLRRWHTGITAAGIEYAWDDTLAHYREATLYYGSGAMSLIGTFDAGNERGAALVHAYSTRILEHAVDIDAGSVL